MEVNLFNHKPAIAQKKLISMTQSRGAHAHDAITQIQPYLHPCGTLKQNRTQPFTVFEKKFKHFKNKILICI